MRLFDTYIAIDWSSKSVPSPARPSADAIWISELTAKNKNSVDAGETYWRTRVECIAHLRERLSEHIRRERRVFIGFDFAYGFPTGFAESINLRGPEAPWRLVWDELSRLIKDDDENRNNRFEVAAELNRRCGGPTPGPLWGVPAGRSWPTLQATSPGFPYYVRPGLQIEKLRRVDRLETKIQPIWKIAYTASVGGQTLVGIPAVCRLRDDPDLKSISKLWPFETGFTTNPTPRMGPFILHVEIWPGAIPAPLDPNVSIRDQAQVRAVTRWLWNVDQAGQLGAFFGRPKNLTETDLNAAVTEEGWIIGAGSRHSSPEQIALSFG